MFPLSSVLFPNALLPLRVFEPRYLTMIERCLAGDRRFGVVLIERGPEVGGGDQRFDVGTAARILQVGELDGGHLLVLAAGERRIRVAEWLPDDPHPVAMVEPLPDDPGDGQAGPERIRAAARVLRRVLGLAAELGAEVGAADFEVPDEPGKASFQLAALAPLAAVDAQEVLQETSAPQRLGLLTRRLTEVAELLEARLAAG